jgi:hypothetical protein
VVAAGSLAAACGGGVTAGGGVSGGGGGDAAGAASAVVFHDSANAVSRSRLEVRVPAASMTDETIASLSWLRVVPEAAIAMVGTEHP